MEEQANTIAEPSLSFGEARPEGRKTADKNSLLEVHDLLKLLYFCYLGNFVIIILEFLFDSSLVILA